MEKEKIYRRGAIIMHKNKEWRGVVIDWGMYNRGHRRFMIAGKDSADSIRVWTKGGRIEVWPAELVKIAENTEDN